MVPFGSRGIHGENPQYHAELSIILHVALGVEKDDLFTCGSDNQLWHKWVDDSGTLHEWESLRGRLTSGPAAISVTIGKIDVFVRGTDGALWEDTLTRVIQAAASGQVGHIMVASLCLDPLLVAMVQTIWRSSHLEKITTFGIPRKEMPVGNR